MHPYRSHTCGALPAPNVGETVRLSGWVHRVRDHGGLLFIDLRDHYGLTQIVADPDSPAFAVAETVRSEWVIRVDGTVKARSARRSTPICRPARSRSSPLDRGPVEGRRTAAAGVRRAGISGGDAAPLPLPRPPPRAHPPEYPQAGGDHLVGPPPHGRCRLLRVPDPDPDGILAGRRARFPRAVAPPSRQVLRAAAGAAAVQAADHDRRLRPLFPDRAVLPRRGRPRRPLSGRVLPARYRDELRRRRRTSSPPSSRCCAASSRSSATASR